VKRFLAVFVVVLLAAVLVVPAVRVGGSSMPFNVGIVKKSIVFLYYPKGKDFEVGTGFLVDIPSKEDPKQSSVAIVTARHIVDPKWAACSWANPQAIYARVNAKNFKVGQTEDGTDIVPLSLVNAGKNVWYASPNDRVDVAVIPVSSTHVEQLLRNEYGVVIGMRMASVDVTDRKHIEETAGEDVADSPAVSDALSAVALATAVPAQAGTVDAGTAAASADVPPAEPPAGPLGGPAEP